MTVIGKSKSELEIEKFTTNEDGNAAIEVNNEDLEAKQDEIIEAIQGQSTSSANTLEGKGNITVGTSQVGLTFTGTTKSIRIQADSGNSGIIYIGNTGVANDNSNDYARLSAGQEIVIEPYEDSTNSIYLISDTAGQIVNVGATTIV